MKVTEAIVLTGGMCLILGLAMATQAQQSRASGASAASNVGKTTDKADANAPENDDALHLTDAQKEKIKSIRADAKQRALEVQKDASLSDDVKERKIREIKKETRVQVWGAMTPEQQQQWANEQRARREARREESKP
jgi:Skp family chaperone for outer membrane proteins